MSRSLVLSNGHLTVALDAHGMVRDLYFPHVGLENHLRGHYLHRMGIWVDGEMHWLSDGAWIVNVGCSDAALEGVIEARHEGIGVSLFIHDIVCDAKNIYLRRVAVKNCRDDAREIKLYFSHQFEIQKMHGSDTAYFDPVSHSIIHYKGRRVFLTNGLLEGESFVDFATGRAHFQGKEGSHRDAEDGELSKNPIEHGPADSVIGFYAPYAGQQERVHDYWLIAAESIAEAQALDAYVRHTTPEKLRAKARDAWKEWLTPLLRDFHDLNEAQIRLYKQSLMYARAHVDHEGGIIASVDSEMFQYGLDTYSYVWMRDSAYVALALLEAGNTDVAKRFFEFCAKTVTVEGYFMHKYQPDGALGSSWHPWMVNGRVQLPIQEDETAIVLYVLEAYMERTHDTAFLESVYEALVERPADFLVSFRAADTHLPEPSYDLWERKRGTSTYTSASVFGGLKAAAKLAKMVQKDEKAAVYDTAAREVHHAILTHLFNPKSGHFYNMLHGNGGAEPIDATIDISSAYGVFEFGVLPANEMRLLRAFEASVQRLSEGVTVFGVARFEDDDYYRVPGDSTGNPWFLTTLWYAEYLTAVATTREDLRRVYHLLDWAVRYALPSGVLSEQLDPKSGAQICAGPLAWTHAGYVRATLRYLERLESFGG